jgi:hypothetical protein
MIERTALALLAAAALSGCGYNAIEPKEPEPPGQSYPEAVRVFCDVDKLAGLATDDDRITLGQKRGAWIKDHVENPDGIYLRTILSVKGAADQASELRREAKETGISRCALADDLEKNGDGGLAP